MYIWQALVLLRSESRNKQVESPPCPKRRVDQFVMDALENGDVRKVQEHTSLCTPSRLRLKDARDFARLLPRVPHWPERSPLGERRREPRFQVAEPATITVCDPLDRFELRGAAGGRFEVRLPYTNPRADSLRR